MEKRRLREGWYGADTEVEFDDSVFDDIKKYFKLPEEVEILNAFYFVDEVTVYYEYPNGHWDSADLHVPISIVEEWFKAGYTILDESIKKSTEKKRLRENFNLVSESNRVINSIISNFTLPRTLFSEVDISEPLTPDSDAVISAAVTTTNTIDRDLAVDISEFVNDNFNNVDVLFFDSNFEDEVDIGFVDEANLWFEIYDPKDLHESIKKPQAKKSSLTERFMSIHEKPSTRFNKNLSRVYEMLDKYGTEKEDVDKVFNRATLKERLEMVKLLKEGTEAHFF